MPWVIKCREFRNYVYLADRGGWTDYRYQAKTFSTEQDAELQKELWKLEDAIVVEEKAQPTTEEGQHR